MNRESILVPQDAFSSRLGDTKIHRENLTEDVKHMLARKDLPTDVQLKLFNTLVKRLEKLKEQERRPLKLSVIGPARNKTEKPGEGVNGSEDVSQDTEPHVSDFESTIQSLVTDLATSLGRNRNNGQNDGSRVEGWDNFPFLNNQLSFSSSEDSEDENSPLLNTTQVRPARALESIKETRRRNRKAPKRYSPSSSLVGRGLLRPWKKY